MATTGEQLIADLQARGLIAQVTADQELVEHLDKPRTLYCGFDPTADSLHIGSLVPLLTLKRFQNAGHRPIALVGGATGLVGDPSGKSEERNLNTPDVVAGWVDKLRAQVSRFIDFECGDNSAVVSNNLAWAGGKNMLDFLREIGKHFAVNQMVKKESVRQRIQREGEGISFTEFSYMILQSWDFAELNKSLGCTLQIGGSDQWGNITGGTDLTRRLNGEEVFGLTMPLVTKSDGTKFGKTEAGTIWLDPSKTSPYAFYQFWINTADADVYKFLRYFTFVPVSHITQWEQSGDRHQKVLADEVTRLVHGEHGLLAAQRITAALFGGSTQVLTEDDIRQLRLDGLPSSILRSDDLAKPLTALLTDHGVGQGKQIKDALGRRAVLINEKPVGMDQNMTAPELLSTENARYKRFFLVKVGKKKHHLFELV